MIDKQQVIEICRRACAGGERAASIGSIYGINLDGGTGGISDIQLLSLLGLILINDGCGDVEKNLTPEDFDVINAFYEAHLTGSSE